MEDYSAISFVQCFIRLSFVVGYPKKLLPQERSQLIFGCESMRRNVQEKKITSISKRVVYGQCPTATRHIHGKVEPKISQII